jgi:hypothetical protein
MILDNARWLPGGPVSGNFNSQLLRIGVGVEKLILVELAQKSSLQNALKAIFSDQVDIFYHRI